MLFDFLKYLQPTNYFALIKKDKASVFPIPESLPKEIIGQLEKDINFKSDLSQEYDLSWQAIQKGYVGNADTITKVEKLPLKDEYHFMRKYFNSLWINYILLIRLLSFRNPFKEIPAWFKTRKTKRSDYLKSPILYKKWDSFESSLLKENPLVSVVIPTLNRYKYLYDALKNLENQDYQKFEVIVVDQSEPFQKDFYDNFKFNLNLSHQEEKALWLARNTAIRKSNGELLLFFDDDSRVEKNWISNHIKCLDFFNAEISSGVSISKVGAEIPENYFFFRISDQLDSGNVMIKKEVFQQIGLFDCQFEKQRMGDGEFGLRSYLQGFLNISNPYAERLHLKVGTGGLRQMGSWDAFRTKKWFAPRPIPSILYLFRKYYGTDRSCFALLKTIPPSIIPYRFKRNKKMLLLGVIISVFLLPLILVQVGVSWKQSSVKLKQGALISDLK